MRSDGSQAPAGTRQRFGRWQGALEREGEGIPAGAFFPQSGQQGLPRFGPNRRLRGAPQKQGVEEILKPCPTRSRKGLGEAREPGFDLRAFQRTVGGSRVDPSGILDEVSNARSARLSRGLKFPPVPAEAAVPSGGEARRGMGEFIERMFT